MVLRLALLAVALAASAQDFSNTLWRGAEPFYKKSLAHPFLQGLTDGTLAKEKFHFYMLQDALYLRAYSKALSVLAAKAPREEWALFLNKSAIECLEVEAALHGTWFTKEELRRAAMAPTNLAYTNHMLAAVHQGSFAEGMAAVLPCYWIYWEVGKALVAQGSKDARYQKWIDQYAGEAYGKSVRQAIAIFDAASREASNAERERMEKHFLLSSRYEYLFWDHAWRLEKWLP
jgi:thiaminase (transcriptional activator TenA)